MLVLSLIWAIGCGDPAPPPVEEPSPAAQWREAQEAWRLKRPGAYALWFAVDPDTPQGREARRRIALADAHAREGRRLLQEDDQAAGVAEMNAAARIAPIDPLHYLDLARYCADIGEDDRAAVFYSKYLAALPNGPQAEAARRELARIDPVLAGLFREEEPDAPPPVYEPASGLSVWGLPFGLGALFGLGLAVVLAFLAVSLRGRGVPLERLAADSPEYHPAIAYLIGTLRHELLKHRIGAAGDALSALEQGNATPEQLRFLRTRLYGRQPLIEAWEAHLSAFERTLGPRVDLRRDRHFRQAGSAIRAIARMEPRLARPDAAAVRQLSRSHGRLRRFDRRLARLTAGLIRTRVDEALLKQVLEEVRGEYEAGQVELDEVKLAAAAGMVEIEVFRVDLVLILKNIVRNAITAVGRSEAPRRIGLDVRVELLPTGDEAVCVRVQDTSREELDTETIYDRRLDRGLGLVVAAVTRYGGSISVEPGTDGFAKGVSIRFFGAMHDAQPLDRASMVGGADP